MSRFQFRKADSYPWHRYGSDYDFSSVMHYPEGAGSLTGKPTMVPTAKGEEGERQRRMMGSEEASPGDYRKLCTLYRCDTCMGRPFNRTSNYCEYPLVPREAMGCSQTEGRSRWSDFDVHCCQTRKKLAESADAPAECDKCIPEPGCHGDAIVDHRSHRNSSCCLHCGAKWLARDFCERQQPFDRVKWVKAKMCPPTRWTDPLDHNTTLACRRCVPDSRCWLEKEMAEREKDAFWLAKCCGGCSEVSRWHFCESLRADWTKRTEYEGWLDRHYCPVYAKPLPSATATPTSRL